MSLTRVVVLVHFTETKGKRDRSVPINQDVIDVLRKWQLKTLKQGGPFIGMEKNVSREWKRIRKSAEVPDVTIHDLRRTYITRLVRAGAKIDEVQKLAGHTSIKTTLDYYVSTNMGDLRAAVARLARPAIG